MRQLIALFLIAILCHTMAYSQNRFCGTPSPSQIIFDDPAYHLSNDINIPVVFRVIYASWGEGNVPLSQLQAQINHLNSSFTQSSTKSTFSFYLAGVSRTQNDNWFHLDGPSNDIPSDEELEMKQALAIDPAHVLNLYILTPFTAGGWLGWSWYPDQYPENSHIHGPVVHYATLTGGTQTDYNEGDVAVHEIGHYLGLYHTYENGCSFPGDRVDDTPYELSQPPDCKFGRDSCPDSSGSDPITNYMDATDDSCRSRFSLGQFARMESITAQYKPSLGGTSTYFSTDLIIPIDRSWEFYRGTFRFASNTKIVTTGSLQVIGTSANPVVFDSSGTSGPWYGIWIENSTANSNFDYCTIQNTDYGIRLNSTSGTVTVNHSFFTNNSLGFLAQYSSPFTVQNSTFENNSYGLYVRSSAAAGNMIILSNTIRYNSYHGIYLYDGADAFLGHNTSTNNSSNSTQAGVFCTTNSDPFIRLIDGVNYGYNIIQNNIGIGVHAASNSYPSLGIDELNKTKYGYNDIHDNNNYEVDNRSGSGTIMAERNYWSADHTNPSFPSDVYGSVDYVPALPESPSDETFSNAPSSQKSLIDFSEAVALEIKDEFQAAADLYIQLLEGDPGADNVGFGVSGLIRCYKALDRRQEIAPLMQQLITGFPQTALATSAKDHDLSYLVQRKDYDQALAYAHELLAQNRNHAEAEPNSLFQVATMYQLRSEGKAGDDLLNAKNTYEELMQKYPNTDFAFFANLELENLEASK